MFQFIEQTMLWAQSINATRDGWSAGPMCAGKRRVFIGLVAYCLLGGYVHATDYSLLGFGTVGYAVSDLPAPYLRHIDKRGTFRADSLIGLQADLQFDPQWGATTQVVGSAPRGKDNGFEASLRWAFVSYRPSNDWLIRAGRLRPPLLNHTQNSEVGLTYEVARLPAEVYSLSPVYDIDGVAVTNSWHRDGTEYSIDGYAGYTRLLQRTPYQRDQSQTFVPDRYFPEAIEFAGVVVTGNTAHATLRIGIHKAEIRPRDGRIFVEDPAPTVIPLPQPLGGVLFVPGSRSKSIGVVALTAAIERTFGAWRASVEYVRRASTGTNMGPASSGIAASASYLTENWRPYATLALVRPGKAVSKYYKQLVDTPVPLLAQGPPLSLGSGYHQVFADAIYIFDQRSLMLGTSYRVSPTAMLKFEWMRTKVGLASALVDGDVHHRRFNVLSMSYNFTF